MAGLSPRTIMTRDYLPALHKAGLVYVASWLRSGTHILPLYACVKHGRVADAPRPPRLTGAQRMARYSMKHKEKIRLRRQATRARKAAGDLLPQVSDVALTALRGFTARQEKLHSEPSKIRRRLQDRVLQEH